MGFTLRIVNAPTEAVLWDGSFAENSFFYDPMADSGWLGIDEVWNYPSDPRGCTTLRIWALDANNNVLFDAYKLGPVDNDMDYIYDYSTGELMYAERRFDRILMLAGVVALGLVGAAIVKGKK